MLTAEGALPEGDDARRARYLSTVLNGLSIARALPSGESLLAAGTGTLQMAVDYVFGSTGRS